MMSSNNRCITGQDATDATAFWEITQVPVLCNVLYTSREDALNAVTGDIKLAFCADSGHIFNTAFDEKRMQYDQAYENSLHFSPRFQNYAKELCGGLIERYDLHGKTLIDVGCGKGDFLKLICQMGDNQGTGFDKSYVFDGTEPDNVTFVQDFYSEAYQNYDADMIFCRHVLEHIEYPLEFVQGIRRLIGSRLDTIVFFEVPNALYTLRDMGIWDIIYEHCSYFTPASLAAVFTEAGFAVQRIAETYGGQFLTIEAVPLPAGQEGRLPEAIISPAEIKTLVNAFAQNYLQKFESWQSRLAALAGQRVVVWGGGSKGVTFLNALKTRDHIRYVVDINPRKQSMYVAGTGQQIVSADFLKDYQPDVVLIMNPLYSAEIEQMLAERDLYPSMITV